MKKGREVFIIIEGNQGLATAVEYGCLN